MNYDYAFCLQTKYLKQNIRETHQRNGSGKLLCLGYVKEARKKEGKIWNVLLSILRFLPNLKLYTGFPWGTDFSRVLVSIVSPKKRESSRERPLQYVRVVCVRKTDVSNRSSESSIRCVQFTKCFCLPILMMLIVAAVVVVNFIDERS